MLEGIPEVPSDNDVVDLAGISSAQSNCEKSEELDSKSEIQHQKDQAGDNLASEDEIKRVQVEQQAKWLDGVWDVPSSGICISGIGGRFPKADSLDEFEHNLREAIDMITDNDNTRWEAGLWGLPKRAGRLKSLEAFDHEFFAIDGSVADYIDPQMRILFEVVYESILDSGINPATLRGSRTGVFLGFHTNEFENAMVEHPKFDSLGYYTMFLPRIKHYFDLRGITLTCDAACASGLVALNAGMQALRDNDVDYAIVCATNISVHPSNAFIFFQMQMLSPTGYSRFLDDKADGYVKTESVVSMFLQREDTAKRNYQSILAVQTSVDGFKKEGITFPSDVSQERLMRSTKDSIKLKADQVQYLEAHGTGTPAGDPQEARSISKVYAVDDKELARENNGGDMRTSGSLAVGSVKTNMGHGEGVSGLCSLAKTAVMLENEIIYKNLHYTKPNKNIESLKNGQLRIVIENEKLIGKIIPISCYGFGGANVHCIVRANNRPAIGLDESLVTFDGSDDSAEKSISNLRLVFMFGRDEQLLNGFFDEMLTKKNCLSQDFMSLLDSLNSSKIDRMMTGRGFMIVDTASKQQVHRVARTLTGRQFESAFNAHNYDNTPRPSTDHHNDTTKCTCRLLLADCGVDESLRLQRSARALALLSPHFKMVVGRLSHELSMRTIVDKSASEEAQLVSQNLKNLLGNSKTLFDLIFGGQESGEETNKQPENAAQAALLTVTYQIAAIVTFRHLLSSNKNDEVAVGSLKEDDSSIDDWLESVSCVTSKSILSLIGCSFAKRIIESEESAFEIGVRYALAISQNKNKPLNGTSRSEMLSISGHVLNSAELAKAVLESSDSLEVPSDSKSFNDEAPILLLGVASESDTKVAHNIAKSISDTRCKLVVAEESVVRETLSDLDQTSYLKVSVQDQRQAAIEWLSAIGELYASGMCIDLSKMYYWTKVQEDEKSLKFPVRRQTPSISSMMKWNHKDKHFVAKYPDEFGKSAAKQEFNIEIMTDRDSYLKDHTIENRVLNPATGYLYSVWRTFSFLKRGMYDTNFCDAEKLLLPIEFTDVKLFRAVILTGKGCELKVNIHETSGKFQILEGGQVCVEGYCKSPEENPNGLLFDSVRDHIKAEFETKKVNQDYRANIVLDKEDVYKQFRVCGYDYGPAFQNIVEASGDGSFTRVQYNGQFIALTDSILQSMFLAILGYVPQGGLFLPTKFDYIRFQPDIILEKIHSCNQVFQQTEKDLYAQANRKKIRRLMAKEQAQGVFANTNDDEDDYEEEEEEVVNLEKKDCFFDTYCDPITGIIITDGIEMRGLKATPAPRRVANNEALLESYQFVPDFEHPVDDEPLTGQVSRVGQYSIACDLLATQVIGGENNQALNVKDDEALERFVSAHLEFRYKQECETAQNMSIEAIDDDSDGDKVQTEDKKQKEKDKYSAKKNGDKILLSLLDELAFRKRESSGTFKLDLQKIVEQHKDMLANDLINSSIQTERYVRPLIETVIENVCFKRKETKLKIFEINSGELLLRPSFEMILQLISGDSKVTFDYSLAHPNPDLLVSRKVLVNCENTVKIADPIEALKTLNAYSVDLIVQKDISCSSTTSIDSMLEVCGLKSQEQQESESNLVKTISLASDALINGGFLLINARYALTNAELALIKIQTETQPDLSSVVESLNDKLKERIESIKSEATKKNLVLVSCKSNISGSILLLFNKKESEEQVANRKKEIEEERRKDSKKLVKTKKFNNDEDDIGRAKVIKFINISTSNNENLANWLAELKSAFESEVKEEDKASEEDDKQKLEVPDESDQKSAESKDNDQREKEEKSDEIEKEKVDIVWLVAASTKREAPSGLIGMMQALRRECGSKHLRCYLDNYSFKNYDTSDKLTIKDFEVTPNFKNAVERDFLWTIIDENNVVGTYRHLTINDYLSYDTCATGSVANLPIPADISRNLVTSVENQAALSKVDKVVRFEDYGGDLQKYIEAVVKHEHPAYINYTNRGDLTSFAWFDSPFLRLDYLSKTIDNESIKMVRVAYSALNFRDVMFATGRLPLDALPIGMANSDCIIGLEFAGVDHTGRRVAGLCLSYALATHIVFAKSGFLIEIPDYMSLQEAATIPCVYLTVISAVLMRGQAKAGESILIHAASGAVGQAALHIARHYKLKVFVTCGTEEKRNFLKENFSDLVDDTNIFNSRTIEFESQIMKATNGKGVDLVLNSLADDKLMASVRCLTDGGRFLEIGKYDLTMNTQLELLLLTKNITVHGLCIDLMCDDDGNDKIGNFMKKAIDILKEGFGKKFVRPIKSHLFERNQVEDAFRLMATGKHIGKVLIKINDERFIESMATKPFSTVNNSSALSRETKSYIQQPRSIPCVNLNPRKSYIVTGGLGGFGLELTKWLISRGAKHLLLTTRGGMRTGYQHETVSRLIQNHNINIRIVNTNEADATSPEGAKKLLKIAESEAPNQCVGGIFHLAMVLKDALLENVTPDDFSAVCKPKIDAAHALDLASRELTNDKQVDLFVAFSSVTSGKGNAGQCNYAYANSAVERICENRRKDNLHGLAIQWGAIGDVGVAFENFGGNDIVIGGTVPQRMPSCFATLGQLLCAPFSVALSVMPVNRGGVGGAGADVSGDLVGAVLRVLGIKDRSKVDDNATLGELGLDSLMAVEIRQYIEREYDMALTIQEIRALTIERIRQIGESGNNKEELAKQRAENAPAEDKKKEISEPKKVDSASYGTKLEVKETESSSEKKPVDTEDKKKAEEDKKKQSEVKKKKTNQFVFDSSAVNEVLPPLILPKEDTELLNPLVSPKDYVNTTPLFFLGPVDANFEQLSLLAARIKRPCIALNWTRKLAKLDTAQQVAKVCIDNINNYLNVNCTHSQQATTSINKTTHHVDIVSFSFGTIIGFEIMYMLDNLPTNNKYEDRLISGKLVFLDASPIVVRMYSDYWIQVHVGNNAPVRGSSDIEDVVKYSEHMNTLILTYMMLHLKQDPMYRANPLKMNRIYHEIKDILKNKHTLDEKAQVCTSYMYKKLDPYGRYANIKKEDLYDGFEAFVRKFIILDSYKCENIILQKNCLLCKATSQFAKHERFGDNYGLSENVKGDIEVHSFEGQHETFISNNPDQLASVIAKYVS